MIINGHVLEIFEREFIVRYPLTHAGALALLDAMVEEAETLGVWPPKDAWEGVADDIRAAEVLCRPSR